ncbi:MAG: 2-hydroxy-3-oxopropionate reductase [Alphaproteobacteria bacterium]|jgi:2-hydroxy-3-oxopropionate reductase|nr:2-hydroxy-3-oxopropionate reductase [Alphaproteobacteria bacterium]PPR14641.1 MAG: 2-hydroxy-3-oxopropionate reductase [Alphaproteobacteria bacterium MarineAlpha12_Bin1]|tara:strand:- start:6793 stop:7674 length:882 start_codon:yes stop_codon:yes gene_type:complete
MKKLTNSRIGVIGIGHMGRPIANNLYLEGANVTVYSRSLKNNDSLIMQGLLKASTPRELTELSDIIILMVTDTESVNNVLHGNDGVIEGLSKDKIVIDMGTTKVRETRQWAEEIEKLGGVFIDAPVSGGQVGAEEGTLSIMVGASTEALNLVMPVFEVLGKNITHIGEIGAGQVAKTANQSIVGITLAAVAEGLTLAKQAGVDPAKVRLALQGGFAESRVLDLHGGRMVERMFEPGGPARVQLKDLDQALELADQVGLKTPTVRNAQTLWKKMVDNGLGDLDQAGIIRVIEND